VRRGVGGGLCKCQTEFNKIKKEREKGKKRIPAAECQSMQADASDTWRFSNGGARPSSGAQRYYRRGG